jgi:hypothetical protein
MGAIVAAQVAHEMIERVIALHIRGNMKSSTERAKPSYELRSRYRDPEDMK